MISDNRSLCCSGVGVTTGAIRFAAASMSAADSGGSDGLVLSSADTGQWCHAWWAQSLSRDRQEE
ncbi:hypothetical protein IWGMT90018_33920 [Mycobacterium kiyosense]|nr:hypothetical protein IWGMT90018_33920 [Mycobacterium kiyosense]